LGFSYHFWYVDFELANCMVILIVSFHFYTVNNVHMQIASVDCMLLGIDFCLVGCSVVFINNLICQFTHRSGYLFHFLLHPLIWSSTSDSASPIAIPIKAEEVWTCKVESHCDEYE